MFVIYNKQNISMLEACVVGVGKLKDRLSSFPVLAGGKYLSVCDCVEYAGDNTDC